MKKSAITTILSLFLAAHSQAQIITTIAGNGTAAHSGDGSAANACGLNHPFGITTDAVNNIFIADRHSNCIRKIDPAGIITTVAGNTIAAFSGDGGPATAASLNSPIGIAVDNLGNIYIGDQGNNRVRKVGTDGKIITIAGNGTSGFSGDGAAATAAQLANPRGLTRDASGNLYIADQANNRVRKVSLDGTITTFAGTSTAGFSGDGGPATAAQLNGPYAVAADLAGNVYIADVDNQRIRKVNTAGIISTIAGNGTGGYAGDGGPATAASLFEPIGVAADINSAVYIADGWNHRIRQINAAGIITTIAGNGTAGFSGDGGPANFASLNNPYGVAIDIPGNIYVADYTNNRVRFITHPTGITNVAEPTPAMNIYPNPNSGQFTIDIPSVSNEDLQITIENVIGATVARIHAGTGEQITINKHISPGIYFIRAVSDQSAYTTKLIIK